MRHLVDHRKLGRTASHRKALFRNMASSLILAERIETTLPKAKELRRVADHLVTLAKDGSLHKRRLAARVVQNDEALRKLFAELAPRFKDRQGGYTRVYRFGSRLGDGAQMAAIEYLGYQLPERPKEEDEEKKAERIKAERKAAKQAAKEKKEAKKAKKVGEEPKKRRWSIFGRKKEE